MGISSATLLISSAHFYPISAYFPSNTGILYSPSSLKTICVVISSHLNLLNMIFTAMISLPFLQMSLWY